MSSLSNMLAQASVPEMVFYVIVGLLVVVAFGFLLTLVKCYHKVQQGTAIVRTGWRGIHVSFNGLIILPIFHRYEIMDVSVKKVEIYRHGSEGLICRDNVRADIKVCFFVRVNNIVEDVKKVAQSLGCRRASDQTTLVEFFDAKFSEALKTVGKRFDFTELYSERDRFKEEIIKVIGTDLNGYVLDDAAIDYLEQTPVEQLDPDNILDAEGIKKITDLTATQQVLANNITREKEKTIKKQDVEAREAILELERQQAEAEEKQRREVATVTARERAEAAKVEQEELLKSEKARLTTEEEVGVQEQNKFRQILVAERNKQRTDAIETERVHRDQQLEATERERVVDLARIEKDKALEVEKKHIQDVIRERVVVERAVVEEEQKIKDTEELMTADRAKKVKVTEAEATAQERLVAEVKAAEASKQAAVFQADEVLIEAEAKRAAAEKEAQAKKMIAEAMAAEYAATGLAEAEVEEAKAASTLKYGSAEADVVQRKLEAEAAGQTAKAKALQAEGEAEATVMQKKYSAEAEGINQKAEAMKNFDSVGKDHEEFKLRLDKDKQIELAEIGIQKDIAAEQAKIMGEALRSSHIDIVGGDGQFFNQIINAITNGKRVDRLFDSSQTLSQVRDTFFDGDPETFKEKLRELIGQFGLDSADIRNLSVAALIARMAGIAGDGHVREDLQKLLDAVTRSGLAEHSVGKLGLLGNGKRSVKN